MLNLQELIKQVQKEGYSELAAEAKVCQDIVLKAISCSSLSRSVTIKGGVVMRSITGSSRRATQDLDLDFIRYSLSDEAIYSFVEFLNCIDGIKISIDGSLLELSQQDYKGKRVIVNIEDSIGNSFKSKIDFGVHKYAQIKQDEYCFDVCLDDMGASLLINSKEQIFTEKLKSLLRFGPLSTRYKDVFDLCYLADVVDKDKLLQSMKVYIIDDPSMREDDINAILHRINQTFSDSMFCQRIEKSAKSNWLGIKVADAFQKIRTFLETMS